MFLYIFTWFTARNIWLWLIPLFIAISETFRSGPLMGFIQFLV